MTGIINEKWGLVLLLPEMIGLSCMEAEMVGKLALTYEQEKRHLLPAFMKT